jgi:hypothetical protein
MRPILRFHKFAVAVLSFSLLCSCTVTTNHPKNPVFTTDDAGMSAKLQRYVQCEHINVAGLEKETNGKVSSQLTVKTSMAQTYLQAMNANHLAKP